MAQLLRKFTHVEFAIPTKGEREPKKGGDYKHWLLLYNTYISISRQAKLLNKSEPPLIKP